MLVCKTEEPWAGEEEDADDVIENSVCPPGYKSHESCDVSEKESWHADEVVLMGWLAAQLHFSANSEICSHRIGLRAPIETVAPNPVRA